jgi:hypothetical protein
MAGATRWLPVASLGCLIALVAWPAVLAAADWPSWRGPTGMGHTDVRDLPLTWGGKDAANIVWKAPLFDDFDQIRRDHNQSSPVVIGEHLFVTASYWPAGVGAV